jgi:hypothetical protein
MLINWESLGTQVSRHKLYNYPLQLKLLLKGTMKLHLIKLCFKNTHGEQGRAEMQPQRADVPL